MNTVAHVPVVGSRPPRPDGADKVTGRARYGADLSLPGMVWGAVLRSPHAHARIVGIDVSAALAMPGVLAVITSEDMAATFQADVAAGESHIDMQDMSRNVLAREKVLYHGHAVAAVAATSQRLAKDALKAIRVDYEALPAVLDIDAALHPEAPVLHPEMFTRGLAQTPAQASNLASRMVMQKGDVEQGFAESEVVMERTYTCASAHQGYIEPHACLASAGADGQIDLWCCTQGHFAVRSYTAALLGLDPASIRVTASEIGGGGGWWERE